MAYDEEVSVLCLSCKLLFNEFRKVIECSKQVYMITSFALHACICMYLSLNADEYIAVDCLFFEPLAIIAC